MTYLDQYNKWLNSPYVDAKTKADLDTISEDEEQIKFRFMKMLDFGTAGLRGTMGAGLNMMNIYTVRYVTQALADLIKDIGHQAMNRGVAIAFDSRNMSKTFATEVACVLAANGIHSYIFDELRPTPELSFALREVGAIAGVNITASHNPKQYNGYKVYWEDGAQLPPDHAQQISDRLNKIDIFTDVKTMSIECAVEESFVSVLSRGMDEKYMKKVLEQAICPEVVKEIADTFKIIYTPFHGSGYRLVPEVLKRLGLKHVITVKAQMIVDGNFPTVKSPNPEDKEGFNIAIEMAKQENIDLIIGTDPDADRVGIVVRADNGEYVTLTGNQVGVLLIDYLIKCNKQQGSLLKNPAVVKSIVSTDMATAVCEKNNITMFNVLTGFKYIGEKIKEFEASGEHTFLFGFEESYGYLRGTYARDKDAVLGSMLIAEMACWYKKKGMSLYDAMQSLYKEYGYFDESVISVEMSGLDGLEKMKLLGKKLRQNLPAEIAGYKVVHVRDYLSCEITDMKTGAKTFTGLPSADVLFFELDGGSSLVIRPSGTEPKVKLYITVKADSAEKCASVRGDIAKAGKLLLE